MAPPQLTSSNAPPDMDRIVQQYGDALMRICFLYLKDLYLAQDAVQDTFLKIYKNYDKFDVNSSEKTWIMRIAINVCKDYLRSAWHRRVNVQEVLDEIPIHSETHEDDTLLMEIMRLKPHYREVILLHYYEGFSVGQIARLLNCPQPTVSIRLRRARQKLEQRLEGAAYEDL